MKINEIVKPSKNDIQIFQDLDGCLADFDKGVKAFTGQSAADVPQNKLWAIIGDQTIKANSNHHLIMQHLENGELPEKYKQMAKVLRGLHGAKLLKDNELTDLGREALASLDKMQDFTIKKDFYNSLDMMPDGQQLWDKVGPMGAVILTGMPVGNWADGQKRTWCKRMLDPQPPMVLTGWARDKHKLAAEYLGRPLNGDVLIDDRPKHQAAWEEAGGKWITHTSAANSIAELEKYLAGI